MKIVHVETKQICYLRAQHVIEPITSWSTMCSTSFARHGLDYVGMAQRIASNFEIDMPVFRFKREFEIETGLRQGAWVGTD